MKKILPAVLFLLLLQFSAKAQELSGISIGGGFSIIPSVNYVSSATIQLFPFSSEGFERSLTEEVDGGYGYSLTIKKKVFRDDLAFGFTIEYLKIIDDALTQTFETELTKVRARVTEELWVMPLEFTGYFNIPDFSDDLKIHLGGGVGAYFGDRKRSVLNLQTKTVEKNTGFSFVILSGIEYSFNSRFSGVFELRFRQGEYKVKSEFPVSRININGTSYPIEKNLNSRIFVDGLKLSLGLAYNF